MCRKIGLATLALLLVSSPSFAQGFRTFPRHVPIMRPFMPFPFFGPNVNFVTALPQGGPFVHMIPGTVNLNTGRFVPGTSGTSVLRGQGVFMPTNGTFVPAANGNLILTTRETFDTKTGKFVPSATGNFLFSQRGDLITSATMSLPTFLPLNSLLNAAALNTQAALPISPYAANPYSANPYAMAMTSPYTSATSSYPIYPPYSMSYAGNYSTGSANDSLKQAYATAAPAAAATPDPTRTALAASGIPMENGHIQWPLAFRTLSPEKKQDLTDRLEAQLVQLTNGAINGTAVDEAKKTVTRLSAWLREQQAGMAEATYRDGARFLRAIDDGLAALKY